MAKKNKTQIKLTPESARLIKKLSKASKLDMRPVMNVVGIGYRKEVKAIFEKKQPRQTGLRWAELSEKYGTWKEVHFPGQPLLVRSGDLKRSMTELGATGNITLIGAASGIFGSRIPYGPVHDEGSKDGTTPKRNFSEPSERRAEIWRGQISRDIASQFEREGIQVKGEILV